MCVPHVHLCSNSFCVPFWICVCASVGCKPKSVGLKADDDINRLRSNSSFTNSTSAENGSVVTQSINRSNNSASVLTALLESACVWSFPVLYEEVDVLSLRFTPANGPNVSVTNTQPTLLTYPVHTQATGGTLNFQLTLNTVSSTQSRTAVTVDHACCFTWGCVCVFVD